MAMAGAGSFQSLRWLALFMGFIIEDLISNVFISILIACV